MMSWIRTFFSAECVWATMMPRKPGFWTHCITSQMESTRVLPAEMAVQAM